MGIFNSFRLCTSRQKLRMSFNRSESQINRCPLYQPDNPCCIDRNSCFIGHRAYTVRHYCPDLYLHLCQLTNPVNFADTDTIVCRKHYKQYLERYSPVRHSYSPPIHGNHTFTTRSGSMRKCIHLIAGIKPFSTRNYLVLFRLIRDTLRTGDILKKNPWATFHVLKGSSAHQLWRYTIENECRSAWTKTGFSLPTNLPTMRDMTANGRFIAYLSRLLEKKPIRY